MSLQYNILWLDDRIEEYQTLEIDTELKEYVETLFFEPHIYMYESVEEAVQNSTKRKYDVIFSDFNINEDKNGKDFIIDIRNKNVNAEVLFYSAQRIPPETGMDRISFLKLHSDISYEDLKTKMKKVIDLTIEKLTDLTNLRGLVMSEVSELDSFMEEIIQKYYSNKSIESEEWKLFKSHIIRDIQKSALKRIKEGKIIQNKNDGSTEVIDCPKSCTHIWMNANTIDEIISNFEFDSSKKAHTISEILKKIKISQNYSFSEYDKEIIQVRNNLAHSKSEQKDGNEILVTKKFGEMLFTQDSFIIIRKNIKKYHDIFRELQLKVNTEVSK